MQMNVKHDTSSTTEGMNNCTADTLLNTISIRRFQMQSLRIQLGRRAFSTCITLDYKVLTRLRAETGISMKKCRDALLASNNDFEQALSSLVKAASSTTMRMCAAPELHHGGIGVLKAAEDCYKIVKVLCKTDFVAKNSTFLSLVEKLLLAESGEEELEMLRNASILFDEPITLGFRHTVSKKADQTFGIYIHNKSLNNLGQIVSIIAANQKERNDRKVSELVANRLAQHVVGMEANTIEECHGQAYLFGEKNETVREYLARNDLVLADLVRVSLK